MSYMRWHPKTKECRIFEKEHEVPAGWLGHHPDDPFGADVGKKSKDDMTRAEILTALHEGGITVDAKAPSKSLMAQLRTSLLATLGIPEGEDDDTPTSELLARVKAA